MTTEEMKRMYSKKRREIARKLDLIKDYTGWVRQDDINIDALEGIYEIADDLDFLLSKYEIVNGVEKK